MSDAERRTDFREKTVTARSRKPWFLLLLGSFLAVGAWWWYWAPAQSPTNAHLEAGWQQLRAGNADGAERQWLRALEIDRKNYVAWEALGDLYLTAQQWNNAQKAYGVLARERPQTPALWTKLARTRVGVGDDVAANAYVQVALKHNADDAEALNIQSTLLLRADEKRERADVLLHLAKLRPDDVEILTKAADALSTYRRYDDAAPLIARLLQLKPDSSAGLAMRGAARFERDLSPQGLESARADLVRSVELQPKNWPARMYLARVYLRQQKPALAVEELKRVDAQKPADTTYLNDLAKAYRQTGQADLAVQTRERFARAESERRAIDELDKRLSTNREDFAVNLELGLKVLQSDNPRGAAALLEKAQSLRPKDARAQAALAQLEKRYRTELDLVNRALQSRNAEQALEPLARALRLRPNDARTQKAINTFAVLAQRTPEQAALILERAAEL